jgi:hypothetical protein
LVALGNVNVGPIPQMNSFEPDGERKTSFGRDWTVFVSSGGVDRI